MTIRLKWNVIPRSSRGWMPWCRISMPTTCCRRDNQVKKWRKRKKMIYITLLRFSQRQWWGNNSQRESKFMSRKRIKRLRDPMNQNPAHHRAAVMTMEMNCLKIREKSLGMKSQCKCVSSTNIWKSITLAWTFWFLRTRLPTSKELERVVTARSIRRSGVGAQLQ